MSNELVLRENRDAVLTLTMNRPERKNAFNNPLYKAFAAALQDAQKDDDVHVVVVTGTAGSFSAGQDFSEMNAAPTGDSGPHGFQVLMDTLCSFDKPLIAAVNGVAVGIGMTMLLHCDVVYLAESVRMRCPFVTLGVVPEAASSYLLPLIIGFQRAAEVLYTAQWIDAPRALELALAARVVPDGDVLAVAQAKAAEIAAHPPRAVQHSKQLLLATRNDAVRAARKREDDAFAVRIGSPENIEAITAFFEKRPADFRKKK